MATRLHGGSLPHQLPPRRPPLANSFNRIAVVVLERTCDGDGKVAHGPWLGVRDALRRQHGDGDVSRRDGLAGRPENVNGVAEDRSPLEPRVALLSAPYRDLAHVERGLEHPNHRLDMLHVLGELFAQLAVFEYAPAKIGVKLDEAGEDGMVRLHP